MTVPEPAPPTPELLSEPAPSPLERNKIPEPAPPTPEQNEELVHAPRTPEHNIAPEIAPLIDEPLLPERNAESDPCLASTAEESPEHRPLLVPSADPSTHACSTDLSATPAGRLQMYLKEAGRTARLRIP